MNPYEIPGGMFTLNATEAVPRHRFVKSDSNGGCVVATAADDPIVGVSYTEADATQPLSIAGAGIVMVEASATIDAGKFVTAGADGKAAAATEGPYVALTSASGAGTLVTVKIG